MKETLNRKYLLVVVIVVSLIIVAAAVSVSIEEQQSPADSGSVLHAVDVLPESGDFGEGVELSYGHIEDWESVINSMNSPLLQGTMIGYNPEDRQMIEESNRKWISDTSELLDHGVIDLAKVSYVLYDNSGEVSDLTSADIYAFNETEGAEWYLDKIVSGKSEEGSYMESVEGPWAEAFSPNSPWGGSDIYYVRCSNIVFSTFSTDGDLSRDMAEKIAGRVALA
ncbi:hypothetical protein Mpet_0414 [Methanolacinia petrolearia DSM 11571]|uniref:Uncharacterized protein n=1 Tax=Methanolacinia petrolearia (strain DSM 11571 / OCM 486 / SEBR 4847) TaxID=679926 RepID=E1RGH7_METP4|nr:hypothetical protein [Methanolacinia petrolearia]ADN35188.1 hypothetical protein Mpet_0414 [Methanolacinia petrolearia DSM 11571]